MPPHQFSGSTSPHAARALSTVLLCCYYASVAAPAQAARPMVTDDARIVDPGACQVESWWRENRGSHEFWALPGCNFTGNLEVTLGGTDQPEAGGGRAADFVLQGKGLIRELKTNGYGYGLVAGGTYHSDRNTQQEQFGSFYSYVPVSASFRDDQVIVHANLGGLYNRDDSTKAFTWGVGTEINLTSRFALIAETYGNNHARNFYQAGVRFWVVPNRFQIDTTMGVETGSFGPSRWWTIGVRLLSPAFMR